jgi:hypothetical protein
LTARNAVLQAELERLTRDAKRQAAPFSKGTRVAVPKRKRKPGAASSPRNPTRQITAPHGGPHDVAACPECGGTLVAERVDVIYNRPPPCPAPW